MVTVPVPMPVEQPAPAPAPPGPVPVVVPVVAHPTPRPVAIATPTPKPAEVPVPVGTPSASELAALYRDVGTSLQKLDRDKADELWVRYRWIRLADYLATPDKRAEGARLLTAIASDARRK